MRRLTSAAHLRRVVSIALTAMVFASLVGVASPALAVRTLGLSSPSFDFNVAPGGAGSGELFVINDGTEPLRVLVYFSNQKVDTKGNQTFQTPTRDSDFLNSPASWCQVQLPKDTKSIGNVPFLDLRPKEKIPVKFTFDVPQGVAPGDHQVFLFFEMISASSAQSGVATSVQGRLGTHIRIRIQGAVNEALDVRPFTVRQLIIGDAMPWQFTIRNDGNIDERVTSTLSVLDGSENERVKSDVVTGTVVYAKALSERSGGLPLKSASLGQFTVRLTTSYADGSGTSTGAKTVVKDRTVWVVPLWLAIVLVAAVGLLALWLSWRAAVRSAERRIDRRERRGAAGGQRGRGPRGRATRTARGNDYEEYGDEYERVDGGSRPAEPAPGSPEEGPRE